MSKEPLHNARFLMAETAHERLPHSDSEVAFIGRSNVGKSSLLNALCNNGTLARVSKTPGATRGINVYEVRPRRWMVDLPGYGYAVGPAREREYWPEMIGKYLAERPMMKQAYVLIDAEVGAGDIDISLVKWLADHDVPYRLVGTKTDRLGRHKHATQRAKIAATLGGEPKDIFWLTSRDGFGIASLQQDVIKHLGV